MTPPVLQTYRCEACGSKPLFAGPDTPDRIVCSCCRTTLPKRITAEKRRQARRRRALAGAR